MPRCIALGCTSGYTSNHEKVHFFYVPKNENVKKAWQAVLRRKDISINSTQAVCHHHFLSTDILWKREICDKEGNVLGVSAPYKIPKLRKGVVPSQFPWFEKIPNNIKNIKEKKDLKDIESISISTLKSTQSKNLHIEEYEENEHATVSFNNIIKDHMTILSFDSVVDILNKKEFNMPSQWIYGQYCNGDTRLLIFFLAMCNKMENYKDRYLFNPIKEVILKEDMTLQINILRQPVLNIPSHIQIHNNINSINQLQETLFSFDSVHICCGADNSTNKIEDVEYNEAFKDINGTWRHKKCLLFSSSDLEKCKFCSIVKKSVNQKYRRTKIKKYKI